MAVVLILPSPTIKANAQGSATTGTSPTLERQQQSKPNLHLVKITSPTKNQQVATGKDLTITGTSADNATSDCKVSIIVNGIKPYRVAFPNGDFGGGDYSKWNYTLTPAYTNIKQGQNKITAKFSCSNDPTLISHSSVNVTGLTKGLTTSIVGQQQPQPYVGKNSTFTNLATTTTTTATATATPSTFNGDKNSSFSHPGVIYPNNGSSNRNPHHIMSVSIHVVKSIHPGDKQTIAVKVSDKNSTIPITGASVFGRITEPSGGLFKQFDGTTNEAGKATYSWTIGDGDSNGKYNTIMEVSASGYENATGSATFKVSPVPVTTSTSGDSNKVQLPSPNSNANNDNSNNNNHPSTIIQIPHIHIPKIKIPFHLPFH
jgi:hypothetical protein